MLATLLFVTVNLVVTYINDKNNKDNSESSNSTSTINVSEIAQPTEAIPATELLRYTFENKILRINGKDYTLSENIVAYENGKSINTEKLVELLQKDSKISDASYIISTKEIVYINLGDLPSFD